MATTGTRRARKRAAAISATSTDRTGAGTVANPVPADIALSVSTIAYNAASGAVVGVLSVTDPGESSWTFALTGGSTKFALSAASGSTVQLLRGLTGTLTAGVSESVQITVTDGAGGQRTETFSITVFDPAAEQTLFSRQMVGKGAAAGATHIFAQPFGQGTVPAGSNFLCRRGSNNAELRTQWDIKTTWPDGSAKWVVFAVQPPTLAANATENLVFTTGTHSSPGAAINMATALSGRSAAVRITPSGGSAWTLDLVAGLTADRWMTGELAAQGRISSYIPSVNFGGSTGGLVDADLTITQEGSLFVDVWVANIAAAFPDTGVVPVTFLLEVLIDGAVVLSGTATNLAPGAGTSRRIVGRTAGGAAVSHEAIYLRPANDEMRKAGICGHYRSNYITDGSALISEIAAQRSAASWNYLSPNSRTPLRDLVEGGPTGGSNQALYGIPFSNYAAAWMSGGPVQCWDIACEQAEAAGAAGMFPFDKTNGRWVNAVDRPGFRCHTSNANFVPTCYTGLYSFMDDGAHHPPVSGMPLLLGGRRGFLENMLGYTAYKGNDGYNTSGSYRIWADPWDQQLRSLAYNFTEFGHVIFCLPSGYPRVRAGWHQANLNANLAWLNALTATMSSTYGQCAGFWPTTDVAPLNSYFSHWMYAIMVTATALLEKQGHSAAATLVTWMLPFAAGSWTWTENPSRWPTPLRMAYQQDVNQASSSTAYLTTRAAWIARQEELSAGLTVGATDQMHARLNQKMLAVLASVRPSDATIQAACSAFDAGSWPGLTASDLRGAARQAVFRPPGYAVPGPY